MFKALEIYGKDPNGLVLVGLLVKVNPHRQKALARGWHKIMRRSQSHPTVFGWVHRQPYAV